MDLKKPFICFLKTLRVKGFQNGNLKLHFYNPYLESLDTDFEVGYLYEFVVKFSNNLHLRFSFK